MKYFFLFLSTIVCINSYSQISFEKGYYINNSDQKIECLIKNVDWGLNPTNFKYKTSETSGIENIDIKSVKEFGIYNSSKYIRETVKIDISSEDIAKLNHERNPNFVEEVLFLKVLVEGGASLYYYENEDFKRFFYNADNSNIEQLIYKSYKNQEEAIVINSQYKQQLWTNLKSPTIEIDRINQLQYEKNNLIDLFIEYNKSNDLKYINYKNKIKKDLFNLSFRVHLNNSSLSIQNQGSYSYLNTDFGSKFGVGVGLEAEIILPFNNNKWSMTIEPTYQSFKTERNSNAIFVSGGKLKRNVNYSSVEVPLSVRHYFFLKNSSKIFINASYIVDFAIKSSIEYKREDNTNYNSLKINSKNNFGIGLGYKLKDKYSIEMRYQSGRNILGDYAIWNSDYNKLSIILGYSML